MASLKSLRMQRPTLRCAALLLVLACASLARAEGAQSSAKSQLEQMAHAAEPTTGDEICRGSCECV